MLLPKKNVGLRPFPKNYSSLILFRHGNITFFAESPPTCPLKRAQSKVCPYFFFAFLSCHFFFGLPRCFDVGWAVRKHFCPPPKKKENLSDELLSFISGSLEHSLKLLSQTSQRYFKSLKHMLYAFDHSL